MNREQEMVSIACKAIDDKKALDIKVIDIREVSVIADYFVITSGSNLNQVQAIVDMLRNSLEELDLNQNRLKEQEIQTGFLWIMVILLFMCLMKKIVFFTILKESGEMEKNWMFQNF